MKSTFILSLAFAAIATAQGGPDHSISLGGGPGPAQTSTDELTYTIGPIPTSSGAEHHHHHHASTSSGAAAASSTPTGLAPYPTFQTSPSHHHHHHKPTGGSSGGSCPGVQWDHPSGKPHHHHHSAHPSWGHCGGTSTGGIYPSGTSTPPIGTGAASQHGAPAWVAVAGAAAVAALI